MRDNREHEPVQPPRAVRLISLGLTESEITSRPLLLWPHGSYQQRFCSWGGCGNQTAGSWVTDCRQPRSQPSLTHRDGAGRRHLCACAQPRPSPAECLSSPTHLLWTYLPGTSPTSGNNNSPATAQRLPEQFRTTKASSGHSSSVAHAPADIPLAVSRPVFSSTP